MSVVLVTSACHHAKQRPAIASSVAHPTAAAAIKRTELPPLPEVERWRLRQGLAALSYLERRFQGIANHPACILLIDLETQWLLNCAIPLPSFEATAHTFLDQPVFVRRGGSFRLAEQEIKAAAFVQMLPATVILQPSQGEGQDHTTPTLLVATLDALVATHPAFSEQTPSEEWMGVFVHEYFHVQQMLAPSFTDELAEIQAAALNPMSLTALYENNSRYRALIEAEYALLSKGLQDPAPESAQQTLRAWCQAYVKRRGYLERLEEGPSLVRADAVFTYLEGVARYVESVFLTEASYHSDSLEQSTDQRYGHFRAYEGKGYAGIPSKGLDAQYFYSIGMHLAFLLDRVAPGWGQHIQQHPNLLVGTVLQADADIRSGTRTSQVMRATDQDATSCESGEN